MATNMKKVLRKRVMGAGAEKQPVPGGAKAALTGVVRGGGKVNRVYSGAKIEKYGKAFKKSQTLPEAPKIQPGKKPTKEQLGARKEFRGAVSKRHGLNTKLIRSRYGKSRDWHKRLYGPGYKEGTVGRLGTKIGAQRAHVRGQKASIYKLGQKLKKEEGAGDKDTGTEAAEAAKPSDRAKALEKRITQLQKNLKTSSKNLGTTKAEKQKYIDKRNKMLQHLYTLSRSKPGSLSQARKAEAEGRLKKARYHAPGTPRKGRAVSKGHTPPSSKPKGPGTYRKPSSAAQGKTDQNRHPGYARGEALNLPPRDTVIRGGKSRVYRGKALRQLTRAQIRRRRARRRHRANR